MTAKALTVRQFYHVFHFVAQNAPVLRSVQQQQRRQRQQHSSTDTDGGGGVDSDDGRVCSVCLSADVEVALPCLHAYCDACIADWHTHDQSCPLCRQRADVNGAAGDAWTDVWRLDGGSEAELDEVCRTISCFPHQFVQDKPDFIQ